MLEPTEFGFGIASQGGGIVYPLVCTLGHEESLVKTQVHLKLVETHCI